MGRGVSRRTLEYSGRPFERVLSGPRGGAFGDPRRSAVVRCGIVLRFVPGGGWSLLG